MMSYRDALKIEANPSQLAVSRYPGLITSNPIVYPHPENP